MEIEKEPIQQYAEVKPRGESAISMQEEIQPVSQLDYQFEKMGYGVFVQIMSFLDAKDIFISFSRLNKTCYRKVLQNSNLIAKEKIQQIAGLSIRKNPEIYMKIDKMYTYKGFLAQLLHDLKGQYKHMINFNEFFYAENNTEIKQEQNRRLLNNLIEQDQMIEQIQDNEIQMDKYRVLQNQQKLNQQKQFNFKANNLTCLSFDDSQLGIGMSEKFLILNKITLCRRGKFIYPAKTGAIYTSMSKKAQPKVNTRIENEVNEIKDENQLQNFILRNRQLKVKKTNIQLLQKVAKIFDKETDPKEFQYVLFEHEQTSVIIPPTSHKQHLQYFEWYVEEKYNEMSKLEGPNDKQQDDQGSIGSLDEIDEQLFNNNNNDKMEDSNNSNMNNSSDEEQRDEIKNFSQSQISIINSISNDKRKSKDFFKEIQSCNNLNLASNGGQGGGVGGQGSNPNTQFQVRSYLRKKSSVFNQPSFKQLSLQDLDSESNLNYQMDFEGEYNILGWFNYTDKKAKTQQIKLQNNELISSRHFRLQLIDFDRKKNLVNARPGDINLNMAMFYGQIVA